MSFHPIPVAAAFVAFLWLCRPVLRAVQGSLPPAPRREPAADAEDAGAAYTVPLPLAIVVGLGLTMLWEAVHPRVSDSHGTLESSMLRQVFRRLCCRKGEEHHGKHGKHATHQAAATALMKATSSIYKWAPKRMVARATTCLAADTNKNFGKVSRATVVCQTPGRVNSTPSFNMGPWADLEANPGPLAGLPSEDGSLVFFAEHTTLVEAGSEEAVVRLFRVGDTSSELPVPWSTADGTALQGIHYVNSHGTTRFQAGAATAEIRVNLLQGQRLFTRRFFVVRVALGRSSSAALCGPPFARVRVRDAGSWPPDLSKTWMQKQSQAGHRFLAAFGLVIAFVRMLVHYRGRKYWRTLMAGLFQDFHHVVLSTLLLKYALYDLCLARADEPEAYRRLVYVVLLKLFLVLLDRVADHVIAISLGAGGCTNLLQSQLMHRFIELAHDPVDLGRFYHLFHDTAPDAVAFAYKPTFKMVRSVVTLLLSLLMALALPMLRGQSVQARALRPLYGIAALVPLAFLLAVPARRREFEARVQKRRDAHVEACGSLQEILACRHGLRAFDGAYPAQQATLTFDAACKSYHGEHHRYASYKDDTQWVAKYLGEMAKLLAMLYGGYAALHHARTGEGTMTLGQFGVILSLYGSIIGALYGFIEAYDGFVYARILLEELARFFDEHKPARKQAAPADPAALLTSGLSVKFDQVSLDMELEESGLLPRQVSDPDATEHGVTAEIPLGCIYGITSPEGWSSTRRYVGALLGGAPLGSKGLIKAPGFVRPLVVAPPASLAAGTVLENLMSYAPSWVRGSDVLALTALLGIPFEAPPRQQPTHDLRPGQLLEVLMAAVGSGGAAVAGARPALRPLQPPEHAGQELLSKVVASFRARMAASGVSVMSPMAKVEPILRPHEAQLLALARGLVADPDVLVVQDQLAGMPPLWARAVIRLLQVWQRLGGFKGMAGAWERSWKMQEEEEDMSAPGQRVEGFPEWITEVGSLVKTLVLSESSLVTAGLEMRSHVDAWLVVGLDRLEVTAAAEEDPEPQQPTRVAALSRAFEKAQTFRISRS